MYGSFDGYEQVTQWDITWESYQFNILGVWKREVDGKYFFASDSGCSCPGHWENLHVSELDPLREDWEMFKIRASESSDSMDIISDGNKFLQDERNTLQSS